MEEKTKRHFEAIKDILEKSKSLEWTFIQFQNYVTEHKVQYHIFKAMQHLQMLDIKRTGNKNWIKAKMKASDVEPIMAQHVMEEIRKMNRIYAKGKKDTDAKVEEAVSTVKTELQNAKDELEESEKYPYLDKYARTAVQLLQKQGYKLVLRKHLELEF